MSVTYRAVAWNRQKKIYDGVIVAGVLSSIAAFCGVGLALFPSLTAETLIIRSVGSVAFLLLHVILCIGPLCRLDERYLPLLYNRRHLGVTMALLATIHGSFSILQFHGFGDLNPFVSLLTSQADPSFVSDWPFQPLGLVALIILVIMAATSHDFWLAQLTPPIWKAIHMSVYVAYVLLVGHVALGVLQSETSAIYPILLGLGILSVAGLHLAAGVQEFRRDRVNEGSEYVDVCGVNEIPSDRARIFLLAGERVAVFRHAGQLSAVSNVCAHQNGPLGEGKVVDGCIVCPWHGYQYDPESGQAPAPFTERVPTFDVRIVGDRVHVSSRPNAPGTPTEPALLPEALAHG